MGKVADAKRKQFFADMFPETPEELKRRQKTTRSATERPRKRRKHTQRLHEQRMEGIRVDFDAPYTPAVLGDGEDALVVSTAAVAREVERWLRIPDATTELLCTRAGVNSRVVNRILRRENEYTGFGLADQLLAAMGVAHLTSFDPEFATRPNPSWSQDRWVRWKERMGCV